MIALIEMTTPSGSSEKWYRISIELKSSTALAIINLKRISLKIYFVKSSNPQAAETKALIRIAQKNKIACEIFKQVDSALEFYKSNDLRSDLAIIGSLFLVGDALKILKP